MTKLPLEDRQVRGLASPAYKLNQRCPIPACEANGTERHHLWRRSFLIGDYWWVVVPDGAVVGNCISLCSEHHRLITENQASIVYDDGTYYYASEPLRWQPPFYASVDSFLHDHLEELHEGGNPDLKTPRKEKEGSWITETAPSPSSSTEPENGNGSEDSFPSSSARSSEPSPHVHTTTANAESKICPTCGHVERPKLNTPREKPILRRSWSLAVPVSEQENGAEVLDVLTEEARLAFARKGIAYGEEGNAKYYPVSGALALFVTYADQILSEEGGW